MFILPQPKKLEKTEGTLSYSSFKVNCADADIKKMYCDFSDESAQGIITITKNVNLKEEEYNLAIDESGIFIEYSELVGAFRALSTLKMILSQSENGAIEFVKINDYPSIKNRGYMLDISRGRIPNLSHIKRIVDILADLKYNQLQLYMESLVFEYKNFPEYWESTKPLTQEEIKELDAYCKARYINLIPNQNSFGHMAAWTQKPELSHLAITGDDAKPSPTLNPLKEETLEFIDKIYDGYFDSFSADIVNIGMDEPNELGLGETKEACDKYGVGKVYTDYLKKVCSLITDKYHKTPMFWDDIVFLHPEQLDNLPKDAIMMHWGYESEHKFDRNCRSISERGLKFYVCPGSSMWLTFTGRTNNTIFNMTNAAECASHYGAEGFLLTEWGDLGHPQMPSLTYLPLVFGGCISWSVSSTNENNVLVDLVKNYLDKYIYNTKSEKSLADIVYRMGNYYLLEDYLSFNSTELNTIYRDRSLLTERKREGIERVLKHMTDIRRELDSVTADKDALEDAIFSCDLVIYLAKLVCGIHDNIEGEKENIIERYQKLWVKTSHDIGTEIFIDLLEKSFTDYTKSK